jgi:hypothetical protein
MAALWQLLRGGILESGLQEVVQHPVVQGANAMEVGQLIVLEDFNCCFHVSWAILGAEKTLRSAPEFSLASGAAAVPFSNAR